MKKKLLLLAMILLPLVASAHDIAVQNADGITIYYNYINNGTELEVTFCGEKYDSYENEYTGNVVIPEEVAYLNISRKVTSIGQHAFRLCKNLSSVIISNSVSVIKQTVFSDCYNLTSVTIGNGVKSVKNKVFQNCTGLTSITIPSNIESIGDCAFEGCTSLKKVIVPDIAAWCSISFHSSTGNTSYYANPLYYAKHLYSDENTEIKNLVIPNSVTGINKCAFYGCGGLTSVIIPNSVTEIGEGAFCDCSGLTSITVSNGLEKIGGLAFMGCSNLTKVIVSDIAAWCKISFESPYPESNFYANPLYYAKHLYGDENTEIKNLVIPNSVTGINKCAFYGCGGLTSVIIPNSVTEIGEGAFFNCTGLTSVTIGNSVTSIGRNAFNGCVGLTSVTIPSSVIGIENGAFQNCTGLTSVTIGFSVTDIGEDAFRGCSGLSSVTIPNSVTRIRHRAFRDCTGLSSVTIGNGLTSIGSIGSLVFDGADISVIISLIEDPFIIKGKSDFERTFSQNTFNNGNLFVPKGAIDKYKATYGWKDFNNIVEGIPSGIKDIHLDNATDYPIYDLNGRILGAKQKGINIINGKKVIVK